MTTSHSPPLQQVRTASAVHTRLLYLASRVPALPCLLQPWNDDGPLARCDDDMLVAAPRSVVLELR